MKPADFRKALNASTRTLILSFFSKDNPRHDILYVAAARVFNETTISAFEILVQSQGFAAFIKSRKSASAARLDHTLQLLFTRAAIGIDPVRIGECAQRMTENPFAAAEKTYFFVPVDREGFELFERIYLDVAEQNLEVGGILAAFCAGEKFALLRGSWKNNKTVFEDIFMRVAGLLLAKRKEEYLISCADTLLLSHVERFILAADAAGASARFLAAILDRFYSHENADGPCRAVGIYAKRYRPLTDAARKGEAKLYKRMAPLWDYFCIMQSDDEKNFRAFIDLYGNPRDEFEAFVWEAVFSLSPEKTVKAVLIMISPAFTSLKGFYGHDLATIKFLIKNIIAVVSEMELRDIKGPLYKVVLKLLLGLKVDKLFLKRRADFFSWLKKQSSSALLEMEVIRFLFFEYIYASLKLVETGHGMVMTHFCDSSHRFFCSIIDGLYMRHRSVRAEGPDPFQMVLEYLRVKIWQSTVARFEDHHFNVQELKNCAESLDCEDAVIINLEQVEAAHFDFYYETFMAQFRGDPERIADAVRYDYWYRIPFVSASPYCQGIIVPLIGTVLIAESAKDAIAGAYTNGRTIYLPPYINVFKDPLEPLIDNRNLMLYAGLALHEAGHLLGGSFHFNYVPFISRLEKPWLFKSVFNCFEDYRIEEYLMRIKAHHQVRDIMKTMNEVYSMLRPPGIASLGMEFLLYIFDTAGGYAEALEKNQQYKEYMETLLTADVNTGRFHSLRELFEYGVSRLVNLDAGNPFSAFMLSREFYEIMKLWPEPLTADMGEPRQEKDSHEGIAPAEATPLDRAALDDMYRRYNEDPESFLREQGLPVFDELIKDKKKGRADKEADASQNENISRFYAEFIGDDFYRQQGTIDETHRTGADDLLGDRQKKRSAHDTQPGKSRIPAGAKKEKKKYVYSVDPRTRSRTRLSQVKEFTISGHDPVFLAWFRRWEYLSAVVFRHLSVMMPSVAEEHDRSAYEGDLNMDLLIDTLSEKNISREIPEIFDIYTESRRSLEVIIGLDASGSTFLEIGDQGSVLDIEKAFAFIFARALSVLTENVAVYAFNSVTGTNVYKASTIEAVSMFTSDGSNRDGDFIRYLTQKLRVSDAEVKYFFMLSDGQPCADNYTGKEALDDTLIAMRETVNEGIRLIYFNFDSEKREYFDAFSSEATYAQYFTSPEQILSVIPELVASIVRSIV